MKRLYCTRNHYLGIYFPNTAIGEDAVFFFKCLLNAKKVTVLPVSIYKYHIRGGIENPSLTQIISERFFVELNSTRKLLLEIAEQHQFDYLAHKFHGDIDYTFWMLNKSI